MCRLLPSPACGTDYIAQRFSKAFSMTGWRIGYAVGPQPLVGAMKRLHQLTHALRAEYRPWSAGVVAIERGLKNDWADTAYDRRITTSAAAS
jgi:aminotransferase